MNIKIIVGANFGDEGKGLMTDYFASKEINKCLVVKSNGGSQAGHTVITPDFKKHVFHHFGSGTFLNSSSYLSEDFIINPIIFRKELEELKKLGFKPICFINKKCLITTPYDMLINQILEKHRQNSKHGSCGLGIYETILRNKSFKNTVKEFNTSDKNIVSILKCISDDYIPKRLKELDIDDISKETLNLFNNKNLLENFIDDLKYFYSNVNIADNSIILKNDTILFECGQGLLLDKNNLEYSPHLTPSNTGIKNPVKIIESLSKSNIDTDIEICYVTRTYLTRHGEGRFDTECDKNEIDENICDLTNITNEFQGNLRYGLFDINLLVESIRNDLKNFNINNPYTLSLSITHLNETNNCLKCKTGDLYINDSLIQNFQKNNLKFKKYYTSNGYDRNKVRCHDFLNFKKI